jgi:hypothetical protein
MPHGKEVPHGSEAHTWQRKERTAKGFAVRFVHAHGKEVFTVVFFAGQGCRECTHGKAVTVHLDPFAARSAARQRILFP